MLKVCLITKIISWSDIAFDKNTDLSAMLLVAIILKRLCLKGSSLVWYYFLNLIWEEMAVRKKFWGWEICLFFKHVNLSMLISFMLTKNECNRNVTIFVINVEQQQFMEGGPSASSNCFSVHPNRSKWTVDSKLTPELQKENETKEI